MYHKKNGENFFVPASNAHECHSKEVNFFTLECLQLLHCVYRFSFWYAGIEEWAICREICWEQQAYFPRLYFCWVPVEFYGRRRFHRYATDMVVQIVLSSLLFLVMIHELMLNMLLSMFILSSFKWKSTTSRFFALYWPLRSAKCISEGEPLIDYPFILVFWWVMAFWGSEHILILNSSVAVLWKVILEVGDVLQYYDPVKRFPAWGFGARPIDGPCSHCFNLNGSTYQPEVL